MPPRWRARSAAPPRPRRARSARRPEASEVPRPPSTVVTGPSRASWLRWVAAGLFGLVAATALIDLGVLIVRALAGAPSALGWQGYLAAVVSPVAAAALLGWALRRPARLGTDLPTLLVGLAVLVGLRLVAVWLIDAPLIVDWRRYHELAVEISRGAPLLASRPTGYPILLSLLYRAFGPDPGLAEWLNLGIAVAAGGAIYALALRIGGSRAAGVALLLFAIAPAQVLMTTILGTELLQGCLLTLPVLAIVGDGGVRGGVLAGAALAASQFVRATSVLVALPLAVVVGLLGRGTSRRRWLRAGMLVGTFVVMLLPVVAWNVTRTGVPSLTTSSFQNWQLLIGTNQAAGGRFNEGDLALVGGVGGTPQAEAIALHVALDRIRADPVGIVALDLGKVATWGDEHYGARWALYASGTHDQRLVDTMVLLSQAAWAATALLAAAGLALRRPLGVGAVAAAAVVATLLLAQLPLEANPRYHAPLVPLTCVLAGLGLAELVSRRRAGEAA
jgi:hypothetical protein